MRKKDDGTYSPFQTDEDEASYLKWTNENKSRIEMAEKSSHESLAFMWRMTEWQYERVNTAWNDTLELLGTFKEIIAMKDGAIKTAKFSAVLENFAAIYEHGTRKLGGDIRGMQQTIEKSNIHSAIQDKENELNLTVKPHRLNVRIAKELNLKYDYVRKARAEIKKKRLSAS